MMDAHDLWIGATALTHGLDLATNDRSGFNRLPELTVLSPG
jgi:predicted nucleic acid-binding protein